MKNPSISLIPDLGISKISVATPLAKLARSFFIPDELSGSCGVTSDQLDPEWYVDMQIGKQWKMGPFSDC